MATVLSVNMTRSVLMVLSENMTRSDVVVLSGVLTRSLPVVLFCSSDSFSFSGSLK